MFKKNSSLQSLKDFNKIEFLFELLCLISPSLRSSNLEEENLQKLLNIAEKILDQIISSEELGRMWGKLTFLDELQKASYDQFGRLSGAMLAEPERAFINIVLERLRTKLEEGEELFLKARRPTAFISHDVDKVNNRTFYGAAGKFLSLSKSLLKLDSRVFRSELKSTALMLAGQNTYWNFDQYMKIEDSYGVRSTYFFMLGKKCFHGARYSLRDVATIIKELHRGGWEIGLHVNPTEEVTVERLIDQKKQLEDIISAPVVGARYHWLRFDPKNSFKQLAAAGFLYDCSSGYFDRIGFRNGVAAPFRIYDLEENKFSNFIELPLNVMDLNLFDYLHFSPGQALSAVKSLIDHVHSVNGAISILWHSNVLEDPIFEGWQDVYIATIQYLREKDFIFETGRELASLA